MEPSEGQLSAESPTTIVKEPDASIESTSPTNGNKLKSVLRHDDDDNGNSESSSLVTSETVSSSGEPLIRSKHSTSPTSSSGRDAKRLRTIEQVPSESSSESPQKPLTTVIERVTESPKNGANKLATSDKNVTEPSVLAEIKTESETVSQPCDTSSQEKESAKPSESQDTEQPIEKKTSSDEEGDIKIEPSDSPPLCLFKDEDWSEPTRRERTTSETDGGAGASAPDDADLGRLRWTPSPKDAEMHSPKDEEIGSPDTVEGPSRLSGDNWGKIESPTPIPQQEPEVALKEAKIDEHWNIKNWSPESIPDPAPESGQDQDQDMPSPGQDVPDVASIKPVEEKTKDDEWGDSNTEKQNSSSAVDGGFSAPKKELNDGGWGDDSSPVKEEKTGSDASSSKVQVADDGWGSTSWGGSSSDANKDTVDSSKKDGNDDWSSSGGGDSSWGGGGSGGSFSAGKSSGSRQGKGCFKCGEEGHMSRECPSGGGGGGSRPPGRGCFKCGQEGHMSRECPNSGGSATRGKGCFKCGEEGHMSRECPNSGGGGSRPQGKGCFKCGQEGHMSRECPNSGSGSGGGGGRSSGSKSGGSDWGSGGGGSWGGDSGGSSVKKEERRTSTSTKKSTVNDWDDWESTSTSTKETDQKTSSGSWEGGQEPSSASSDQKQSFWGGGQESSSSEQKKSSGTDDWGSGKGGESGEGSFWGGSGNDGGGKSSDFSSRGGKPSGKGCFKCGEEGHMSRECPTGGGSGSKPGGKGCFKCGQEGHQAKDCTEPSLDADGKPRPPVYKNPDLSEDKALYEKVSTGVNFDRYQELPCSVSGLDVPKDPERYENFEEALKSETIRSGLEATGISRPMPIQKYGMRIVMAGRDLMACAQTGSGKTLAFMLPILQDLFSDPSTASEYGKMPQEPRALIVSPTRELALQIFKEGYKYSKDSIVKIQIIYGGTSTNHQRAKLSEGVHILVGTPGRIIDFLNKGFFNLSKLKYFVLDEADRMIDDGFLPDVRKINSNSTMPSKENRQTLMFSATFPDKVQQVAAEFLKTDYLFLTVGVLGAANADVEQIVLKVEKFSKRNKLFEILGSPKSNDRIMIFVEAKKTADFLASFLSSSDFRATSIHGDRYQHQREEALRDLRSGKYPIIVATSVAARGLDIEGVRHVINYDLPKTIDEYVHRIGRTGRVGNKGKATSFYDPNQDRELAKDIVEIISKANQEVPDWLLEEVSGGSSSVGGADFGGIDCRGGESSTDFKDFDAPSKADAVDLEW